MESKNDQLHKQSENTTEDLQHHAPRDGFDNTGTQGYDSLKDAGYTGSALEDTDNQQSGTGSSSESFHEVPPATDHDISDEDQALDSGI